MPEKSILQTKRLLIRQWYDTDLEPFARLNSDPRVREYFPNILSREESDASVRLFSTHIENFGWGVWAVSLIETGQFIGFIGLNTVKFKAPFNAHHLAVEIGWRLDFDCWGKGYATEGALRCLKYGFESLNLEEIVSFTPTENSRSRGVMERIGMHYNVKDDFDHPNLPYNHPLSRHVLYRLSRIDWKEANP